MNDSKISKIVKIEIIKKSISETLKYFYFNCFNAVEDRYIYINLIENIYFNFFFSFKGQYLTAIFYGFITYYAFPDTWHEKPFLLLFIGICSTIAIALGKNIRFNSIIKFAFIRYTYNGYTWTTSMFIYLAIIRCNTWYAVFNLACGYITII